MAKKQKISDEERKRRSEQMKAMHAARKAAKEQAEQDTISEVELPEAAVEAPPAPAPEPQPQPQAPAVPGVSLTNEQFEMLLQRFSTMAQDKPTSIAGVGIIERFPISASSYKNPVEELYEIPKLRRFGLRENFVIDWKVAPVKYETRQGQWYMEPRFELTLKRKQFDPETGEELVKYDKQNKPFHPRVVLGRASFFVDPPADLIEAELAGLEDAGLSDEDLQDRMSFWRYSSWIEERLIPSRNFTTNNVKEEVIGGKAYEIEEYSMPV